MGVVAGFYLLSVVLLHIPAIQDGATKLFSGILEDLLQTEVSVGKVNIGLPNRVILGDIRVNDQKDRPMLEAARLSAKIELSPLLQGRVSISNVQFYGFDIQLRQERPDEAPNFQFLLDAFAKQDSTPSNPDLRINSVLIRRGKFSWHRLWEPETPGRFNPNHIAIDKLSATLSLKSYTADSLHIVVKKLAFAEQSGLQLKNLSLQLVAGKSEAYLNRFKLELPHTQLALAPVRMSYRRTPGPRGKTRFEDFNFQGSIDDCHIALADFSPLLPRPDMLEGLEALQPLHVEARFGGTLQQIRAERLMAHTDDNSILIDAPLTLNHPTDNEARTIEAELRELRIAQQGIRQLAEWSRKHNERIHPIILSIGTLRANGRASYNRNLAKAQLDAVADLGDLHFTGTLAERQRVKAEARTSGLNLGKLVGKEELLGEAIFDLTADGLLRKGSHPQLTLHGHIDKLGYKGYDYQSIALVTDYKDGGFEGNVTIDDPNVRLHANGKFNLHAAMPFIQGELSLNHFRPHVLALTKRYENTTFEGRLRADFHGNDLEDMQGAIVLDNLRMDTPEESYSTGPVEFRAAREPGHRSLSLRSNFLQAEMEGDFKLATLVAHSRQMLHAYIPSFVKSPKLSGQQPNEVALYVRIAHAEPLEKLAGIPLRIDRPAYANGYFNSQTHDLDFGANIPSVDYNGQRFEDIRVLAGCLDDSISCQVDFQKQVGKSPVDFHLLARAAHDHVHTAINWDNHAEKDYRGDIKADTHFRRDEQGKLLTDIAFSPTRIIVNDSTWNVHSSQVHIAPGRVLVDGFTIDQGERHLMLDGQVSAHAHDTLSIDLQDINLEYVFNIINFHVVDFGGHATGRAYASRLMDSPELDARIQVRGLTFNGAYLGEMSLHGGWGKANNSIFMHALINDTGNRSTTQVDGDIRIGAPPKGGLDLTIRTENIDLAFLNRYTEGIFTGLRGRASGWTRVFGPFKAINLEGDMLVHEGALKVNSTEVEYRMFEDSVTLRPDNIYFRNVRVYDRHGAPGSTGHYAVVNGTLHHTHMSNMTYAFDIDAHNILGYDVREFGDEVFCGTAYASGRINFNGRPGNLRIDINGRPEAGTVFTYNLTSPTTLSDSQFITYKTKADTTDVQASTTPTLRATQPETDILMNFHLDLTPAATMRILMDPKAGDYIALNGRGNIRATYYNKGDFTMYGTYTVDEGIYKLSLQDVIRKDFIFNPGGTIVFGGPPTEADLNLQAVYTVPSVSLNDLSARSTFSQNNVRVNCLMNLGGKALSPQISFDFDIPNVNEDEKQMVRSLISTEEERNMQVIYLLGIGRFYTYDYANPDQSQSSVAMKSLLSSTLSGQLNQMFSSLLGNNSNWNIGTNLSTGDVGWSDMDVEGLLSGRLLNDRLLINGNFGYRDNNTTSTSNFIGDFDLQWLLTRNGNVSLKAYSKTNDRYFTKSSLTTQGIGMAVKRDFHSWRDIFRFFAPKKRKQPAEQQ